jgi:phosphoribosyl 1,2-cyclic phosphate phosphodiesterase
MLKVTILGCGSSAGVPQIGGADGFGDWGACDPHEVRNRRTRSSIVIEGAGGRLLIDTSPDMRTQMLACGVGSVDGVLYTHPHADHVAGFDDIRILNRIAQKPLPTYGTAHTLGELEARFDYAFKPWKPPYFFRPVLLPQIVTPGETLVAAGVPIQVFEQDHQVMLTLGLRSGGFGYSTDVVRLNEAAFAALEGVDTWVVGCFQRSAHPVHANIDLVLSWVERLKPRRTVLTHMGTDLDWAWMKRNLPPHVEPAQDGLVLEIAA